MTSPVITSPSGDTNGTDVDIPVEATRRRAPTFSSVIADEYDHFTGAAIKASATMLVVQIGSSFVIANLQGARFNVSKLFVVPYLTIIANQQTFAKVMSWSTLAAVSVSCFMALWVQHTRRDEPAAVYGWGTGIVMSVLLVFFQFLRGWLEPPAAGGVILAQAAAIAAASAVLFIGLRSSEEPSTSVEVQGDSPSPTNSSGVPIGPPVQRSQNES